MKRASLAAAIAAVFMISTSLFAQTSGGTPSGSTGSPATTGTQKGNTMAPSSSRPAGGTSTGKSMDKATTADSPTAAGTPAQTAPGVPATTSKTAADSSKSAADSSKSAMSGSKLAHGDRKFIEKAAEDGLAEVELGKLAAQKATDPAVKSLAEQMVKDHTGANQKLASLAQSKGITMPTALSHSDERHLHKLEKLSGAKFDEAYVKDMLKDHKDDAKAFDKQAQKAKDPDVKQFAADNASVIHQHLATIEDLHKNLRKGGTAPTRTTSPAPKTTTGTATTASANKSSTGK